MPRSGVLMSVNLLAAFTLITTAAFPYRMWLPIGPFPSFSILDVALIVSALYLSACLLLQGAIKLGDAPSFTLLLVPLLATLLSSAWSQDLLATLRSTTLYIEAIIAYLTVINLLKQYSARTILRLVSWFVIALVLAGAFLLLNVPGFQPQSPALKEEFGDYIPYYARLSHPFLGRSNNLATVLAFFVPVFAAAGQAVRKRRYLFMAIITLVATILTFSRGVLIALLVVGLIYGVGSARSFLGTLRFLALSLVPIGLSVLIMVTYNDATRVTLGDRLSDTNITSRLDLLEIGLEKIASRPLLGYGGGVNPDNEEALKPTVHNTFVQQVIYFGIPLGFAVGMSLVLLMVRFFVWRGAGAESRVIARAVGFSVLGQLLIFFAESSFEGATLRILFYLSLGLSISLLEAPSTSKARYYE